MSYLFSKRANLAVEIRRVAAEEIDTAIDDLTHRKPNVHEAVHEARKHFKKTRSLMRLARDSCSHDLRVENLVFRDLGRDLSETRDAQAMLECWEALRLRYRRPFGKGHFDLLQRQLIARRDRIESQGSALNGIIRATIPTLENARARVKYWSFEETGFDLIQRGLTRCYRRGRKAMLTSIQTGTGEAFHGWRKRVKDHWYHVRLLEEAWPGPMRARKQEMSKLSDLLGDYHDLVVLESWITGLSGDESLRQELSLIIASRRSALAAQSAELGGRVYAEPPDAFAKRIRHWWEHGA